MKLPAVPWTAAALALVAACGGTLPPLRGQMEVGRDSYAVFVGGGAPAGGDLYAVRTEGGPAVQITFTPVGEMRPALSPDGGMVAFIRGESLRDSTPGTVWVLNLMSGAEREIELPRGAGVPAQVGWAPDGRSLVVRSAAGLYRSAAPPAESALRPVPPAERATAESSLAVLLGRPAFARVVPCPGAAGICVAADTGAPGLLARGAHGAFRWGTDSVAYFRGAGGEVEIRPVGPGRARLLRLENPPRRVREMTVFVGSGETVKRSDARIRRRSVIPSEARDLFRLARARPD
jgi:hypothetical protein